MRDVIKAELVKLFFTTNSKCKEFLLICIKEISKKDVPRFWPSYFRVCSFTLFVFLNINNWQFLQQDLTPFLTSNDVNQRIDAFTILHKSLKKFNFLNS